MSRNSLFKLCESVLSRYGLSRRVNEGHECDEKGQEEKFYDEDGNLSAIVCLCDDCLVVKVSKSTHICINCLQPDEDIEDELVSDLDELAEDSDFEGDLDEDDEVEDDELLESCSSNKISACKEELDDLDELDNPALLDRLRRLINQDPSLVSDHILSDLSDDQLHKLATKMALKGKSAVKSSKHQEAYKRLARSIKD